MVTRRFRGAMVFPGGVTSQELDKLDGSPLAISPSAASTQQSTSGLFNAPASLRQASANDSANIAARGVVSWWLEDTAAALLASLIVVGSTGGAAGVVVLPSSTLSYNSGTVISNSTGNISIAFTSTGTSTARVFYALPTGLVVAGSTIDFST